ncbi:MAG: peptide MFS transporter [Candidatus Obscuribacterales bacterium]|nr:peptide MFS transporter [Candidatus Obscuribacterales bacterium]
MNGDKNGLFGHPRALSTLFLIEIWERASYYGMRAILTLYMVAAISAGGLGFSEATATSLYGFYTGSVYLTPLLGGFIADRFLGTRRTLLLGGVIIALGHLCMVFEWLPAFFGGLTLIALGTGLLKPNVSTMIGQLYDENDPRRTAGFNIVYMGINIGAAVAPVVCGFLAEDAWFKGWLTSVGFNPLHSWHWAFGAAGVGMCFGLLQYWLHRDRLLPYGALIAKTPAVQGSVAVSGGLSKGEWHKLYALGFLFVAFTLSCAISEQAGSSMLLFADKLTDRTIGTWTFSSAWMMSLNPIFVIGLTPVFAWLWTSLNRKNKEPSSPFKFAIGMVFISLGTLLMVPASLLAAKGLVSPLWLVGVFFFQTIGELCTSPVGLAAANQLAPRKYASLTMGIWFLSISGGSIIAGRLAGLCISSNPTAIAYVFGVLACISLVVAALLWFLTPRIKKLMS